MIFEINVVLCDTLVCFTLICVMQSTWKAIILYEENIIQNIFKMLTVKPILIVALLFHVLHNFTIKRVYSFTNTVFNILYQ